MTAFSKDVDNSSTIPHSTEISYTLSQTVYAEDSSAGKKLGRNGAGSPVGHQVFHKPVIWLYGKGD